VSAYACHSVLLESLCYAVLHDLDVVADIISAVRIVSLVRDVTLTDIESRLQICTYHRSPTERVSGARVTTFEAAKL
jgi:hypothetical protein